MDDDELRQLVERLTAERESADQDAMAVFREAQVKGTDAERAFAEAAQVKYLLMGKLMEAGIGWSRDNLPPFGTELSEADIAALKAKIRELVREERSKPDPPSAN
jgi:hypothetical protein